MRKGERELEWLFRIARSFGATVPAAAFWVQLQSELDTKDIKERVHALEDPISRLHPQVPELSRILYAALREIDYGPIELSPQDLETYSRPLAILEANGYLGGTHGLGGHRFLGGVYLTDTRFIVFYLCPRFEDNKKMRALTDAIDSSPRGRQLDGEQLKAELDLPLPTIRAVFALYESQGLGILSKETRTTRYCGLV